jgi:hypothetical protein
MRVIPCHSHAWHFHAGNVVALLVVFALVAGLALFGGCNNNGRPKRFQVSGVVIYHGKPLESAQVTFYPTGARPACGTTDANGRFTLLTFNPDDGAVLGTHVVCVTKYVADPEDHSDSPYKQKVQILPGQYMTPVKSPLRCTVTAEGPNDFRLELADGPS